VILWDYLQVSLWGLTWGYQIGCFAVKFQFGRILFQVGCPYDFWAGLFHGCLVKYFFCGLFLQESGLYKYRSASGPSFMKTY